MNFVEASLLLRLALLTQYLMLAAMYFCRNSEKISLIASLLFLTTSLVYGSIVSLLPILCGQVFGPVPHSNVLTLLQPEQ